MEQEHRAKILRSVDKLVRYTNYDILVRACLKQNLLSQLMVDKIQLASTEEARHRRLFEKIAAQGTPNAFSIFGRILEEHFPVAYEILTNASHTTNESHDNRPSISDALSRQTGNGVTNSVTTNIHLNINNNNNNGNNNNEVNDTNTNNNNNYDIHNSEGPSTSRQFTSTVRALSNQFDQRDFIATIQSRPLPGKTHIVQYSKPVNPELNIKVTKSTKFYGEDTSKIGVYPMRSKKRGMLIIVNNIHFRNKPWLRRNGAETDRDNLVHVFREMGFFVCVQEDLTKLEFLDFLKNIVQCRDIRTYDCFMFAVLSHGEQNEVEFVDGGKVDVEEILTKFNNYNCHYLVGKPKIFIFPFCRGPLTDHGVSRQNTEIDSTNSIVEGITIPACIPSFFDMKICYSPGCESLEEPSWLPEPVVQHNGTESDSLGANVMVTNIATFYDMKICYSTVLGYNAFRDPVDGSWYIQILCKVFGEHAHDTHLEDLLKLIGENMNFKRTERDHLQTVSNEDRGFNRILYFNPGYFG